MLRSVDAAWNEDALRLSPKAETQAQQLERDRDCLMEALAAYGAKPASVEIAPPRPYRPEADLIDEYSRRPELRHCLEVLKASLKGCRPIDQENR